MKPSVARSPCSPSVDVFHKCRVPGQERQFGERCAHILALFGFDDLTMRRVQSIDLVDQRMEHLPSRFLGRLGACSRNSSIASRNFRRSVSMKSSGGKGGEGDHLANSVSASRASQVRCLRRLSYRSCSASRFASRDFLSNSTSRSNASRSCLHLHSPSASELAVRQVPKDGKRGISANSVGATPTLPRTVKSSRSISQLGDVECRAGVSLKLKRLFRRTDECTACPRSGRSVKTPSSTA